jgi:hypothetical protein
MIILILELIAVMLSSWLLTKKYFDVRLFSESVLTCFLLSLAQIVSVGLFLGIIGQLYSWNVFMAHLAILLTIYLILAKKEMPVFVKPNLEPFLSSNLLILAFAIFSSFFLIKSFYNLINPPLSPDSLQFHLAFPAAWIRSGSLTNPFFVFGASPIMNPGSLETGSLSYYPINAQLFFTWLMLPLRNAFLADLGEAPFYIIGIIAVYSILRKYNLNPRIALLSGFLWALIPNIFKQLRTGSLIDVICSVLLLLVLYTLLLLKRDFGFRNAILFGISVGLLIGSKITNFVWIAAFLPFICYLLFRAAKTQKLTLGKMVSSLGIITFMIVLFGGYIYLKNYFFTGNPWFPVNFKIFGRTIFAGLLDNATYAKHMAQNDRFDLMNILFHEGLGVQFLTLILPCTFIPLIFYKYLKGKVKPLGEHLLLFLTPLIMLILYVAFIDVWRTRYFFPYLTLGLVIGIIFITRLPRADKYLAFISGVSILAAAFELAKGYELVISILLSLALFIGLAVYKKQVAAFYKRKTFSKVMLIGFLAGSLFLVYFNHKYDREEFDRYPLSFSKREAWQVDLGKGWRWLNQQTKEGARIAYTGRSEFYPLFGARLKNSVEYISINAKETLPYNQPDGLCRQAKDFSAWIENLKKAKIEYLFAALPCFENREVDDPAKFPVEDEWAATHPEYFQLLFSNSLSRIYKVLIK